MIMKDERDKAPGKPALGVAVLTWMAYVKSLIDDSGPLALTKAIPFSMAEDVLYISLRPITLLFSAFRKKKCCPAGEVHLLYRFSIGAFNLTASIPFLAALLERYMWLLRIVSLLSAFRWK
jgi:mannose/fructose/N-acetylgalactosamine-specific phosphotransferase system component IIC